ncbi:Ger(x)C family spore germination protein [Alicyclobacillaceae bacterium I2511]|nr:Ger(x)C family spore germination protein [Alicyclobacillaceae bacterium I2511]
MKQRGKWARLVGIVLLTLMTTTACWDARELDKDASVQILGYDLQTGGSPNKNALITASLVMWEHASSQQGGQGEGSELDYLQASGATFFDAIQNLSRSLANHLDFSHHIASVFSQEMASSREFQEVIDRTTRMREFRRRILFFVTSDHAESVICAQVHHAMQIGLGLKGLSDQMTMQQTSPKIDASQFLYDLSTPGIDPWLPRVDLVPAAQKNSPLARSEKKQSPFLQTNGAGVFQGFHWVGWLSPEDTRGILWLRDQSGEPTFTIPWQGERVTVLTEQIHTRVKVLQPGNASATIPPKFGVWVKWRGSIAMFAGRKTSQLNAEQIYSIEKSVQQSLLQTLQQSVRQSQNLHADVAGFGNCLYRKYPTLYQAYAPRWDSQVFAKSQVEYWFDVHLSGSGLTTRPPIYRP